MILVLDASAAAEVVLQRQKAKHIQQILLKASTVIAPYLFIAEITNVFWKYYQFGSLPLDQGQEAIECAINLIDLFETEIDLYKEAYSMACLVKKPVYDMFYFILARRNNATLITMDKSLVETAKKHSIKTL
ncbi:MAG: type II toxin-antitoxin system VapC family toxin [bacterium]